MPTFSNFKDLLAIALTMSFLLFYAYHTINKKVLETKISQLEVKNSQLISNLKEQNDAVMKWKEASDLQQSKLMKMEKDAKNKMIESQKFAYKMMNQDVPHDCESAVKWAAVQALEGEDE